MKKVSAIITALCLTLAMLFGTVVLAEVADNRKINRLLAFGDSVVYGDSAMIYNPMGGVKCGDMQFANLIAQEYELNYITSSSDSTTTGRWYRKYAKNGAIMKNEDYYKSNYGSILEQVTNCPDAVVAAADTIVMDGGINDVSHAVGIQIGNTVKATGFSQFMQSYTYDELVELITGLKNMTDEELEAFITDNSVTATLYTWQKIKSNIVDGYTAVVDKLLEKGFSGTIYMQNNLNPFAGSSNTKMIYYWDSMINYFITDSINETIEKYPDLDIKLVDLCANVKNGSKYTGNAWSYGDNLHLTLAGNQAVYKYYSTFIDENANTLDVSEVAVPSGTSWKTLFNFDNGDLSRVPGGELVSMEELDGVISTTNATAAKYMAKATETATIDLSNIDFGKVYGIRVVYTNSNAGNFFTSTFNLSSGKVLRLTERNGKSNGLPALGYGRDVVNSVIGVKGSPYGTTMASLTDVQDVTSVSLSCGVAGDIIYIDSVQVYTDADTIDIGDSGETTLSPTSTTAETTIDYSSKKLVGLGDSWCQGVGLGSADMESKNAVTLTAKALGCDYENFGSGGKYANDVLSQMKDTTCVQYQGMLTADIVFIHGGINDISSNYRPTMVGNWWMDYTDPSNPVKKYNLGYIAKNYDAETGLIAGKTIEKYFDDILNGVANNTVKILKQATDIIRAANPNALIIVSTLYCNYTGGISEFPDGFTFEGLTDEEKLNASDELADYYFRKYFRQANAGIFEFASNDDLIAVLDDDSLIPQQERSSDKNDYMNVGHPSANGYQLLSDGMVKIITDYYGSEPTPVETTTAQTTVPTTAAPTTATNTTAATTSGNPSGGNTYSFLFSKDEVSLDSGTTSSNGNGKAAAFSMAYEGYPMIVSMINNGQYFTITTLGNVEPGVYDVTLYTRSRDGRAPITIEINGEVVTEALDTSAVDNNKAFGIGSITVKQAGPLVIKVTGAYDGTGKFVYLNSLKLDKTADYGTTTAAPTTAAPTTAAPTTAAPTTAAPTTAAPTTVAPTTAAPTTVAPTTATPTTAAPTTTEPTTIITPIKYGDANGDGVVNLLDLISIRKYLARWDIVIDKAAADANADGTVNLLDLILMRKYLAKWNVVLGPQK